MPSSTRQASPGPSTLPLHPAISKKRQLSDADQDLARDPKKVKSDAGPEPKDRKRRRKRKRKVSVVAPPDTTVQSKYTRRSSSISPRLSATDDVHVDESTSASAKGRAKANGRGSRSPPHTPQSTLSVQDQISSLTEQLESQSLLLQKHQSTLSQIHQSLTCQICLDLLYKPFALAPCGHIACYDCLVRWFTTTPGQPPPPQPLARPHRVPQHIHKKKSCPICRAVISERPVEVWGIKSMVTGLVKSGLVTLPVPLTLAQTLTDVAATDAPNPDPWHNIFRKARARPGFPPALPFGLFFPPPPLPINPVVDNVLGANNANANTANGNNAAADPPLGLADLGMYDAEDGGIYRCIDCMHEILNGVCTQCHRVYAGHARARRTRRGAVGGARENDGEDLGEDLGDVWDDDDDDDEGGGHGARERRQDMAHLLRILARRGRHEDEDNDVDLDHDGDSDSHTNSDDLGVIQDPFGLEHDDDDEHDSDLDAEIDAEIDAHFEAHHGLVWNRIQDHYRQQGSAEMDVFTALNWRDAQADLIEEHLHRGWDAGEDEDQGGGMMSALMTDLGGGMMRLDPLPEGMALPGAGPGAQVEVGTIEEVGSGDDVLGEEEEGYESSFIDDGDDGGDAEERARVVSGTRTRPRLRTREPVVFSSDEGEGAGQALRDRAGARPAAAGRRNMRVSARLAERGVRPPMIDEASMTSTGEDTEGVPQDRADVREDARERRTETRHRNLRASARLAERGVRSPMIDETSTGEDTEGVPQDRADVREDVRERRTETRHRNLRASARLAERGERLPMIDISEDEEDDVGVHMPFEMPFSEDEVVPRRGRAMRAEVERRAGGRRRAAPVVDSEGEANGESGGEEMGRGAFRRRGRMAVVSTDDEDEDEIDDESDDDEEGAEHSTYAEDGSVRGPSARLRRLMMDADDEESDGDKR